MAENSNPIKYSDLVSPDNSITELIKQLDELNDAYMNVLKNIKGEAIQLSASLRNVSGATEQGRTTAKKASDDADKLARAYREQNFAYSENAKKLAEIKQATKEQNDINKLVIKINQSAEGSYNRLSAQYSLNKIYLNNMTKAERENTAEGRKLEKETRQIYEEMKRLQEATGKYQLNVGNYTDSIMGALGVNNQFGQSLIALGKGGEESKMAFKAIGDGAKALGSTLLGLLKNPVFLAIAGIAAAGAAFKWWFDYNAGLAEATRLTHEFLGVSGNELKALRSEIQSVADVYDKDYKDVLTGVDTLVAQYGISAQQAFEIIDKGFQSGADLSGDFLNKLVQYAPTFRDAGISANEMVAIIQQTRSGIFSDKGLDVIEMASKRIREMSTSTAASLDAIGISSEKVAKDLESGSKSTFDVIQEISAKLRELPQNSQEVGAVLKDVFGRQGAGAGLQLIEQLDTMSKDLDEVINTTGEYGKSLKELRKSDEELQNATAALFDVTEGGFDVMINNAKTFANKSLVAIIKGVINLVNYFIELYNKSAVVRAMWNAVTESFVLGFKLIGNVFSNFFDVISGVGDVLEGVFTLDWDKIKEGYKKGMEAIPNLVRDQVKTIGKAVNNVIDKQNNQIKPIEIPVSIEGGESGATGGGATGGKTAGNGKGGNGKGGTTTKGVDDAYKKNLQARRKAEDEALKLEKDEWKKLTTQTRYQYERQIEDLKYQLSTEKNLSVEARKDIEATIISLKRQEDDALLRIEQERKTKELEWQKQAIDLRLKAVKKGSEEEIKLRLKQIDIEEQMAINKNRMLPAQQRQSESDIRAGFSLQRAGVYDEAVEGQMRLFEMQQELAQSEFDLLKTSEEKKTRFRLQQEKERLLKILELNKNAGTKLSEIEIQTIKNTIAKIDKDIATSSKDEKSKDIYGMLGLNLDDDQKEAINQSVSFAKEQLAEYMQAELDAKNAAVENANAKVDSAKSALDAELEARANGYANNVAMAQKELENAKKNQEKALKEQKKAQAQQQAIQSIEQIGNLVTSTSLIWSQLGFPWAIPAIAVMWGSFAASKIKAVQMAKKETYGDGTLELLSGGSHQSGNDVDLGTRPDGTRRRAEGGEYFAVINKRNSRRFRKHIPGVIKSLNNGTFASKYLSAYNTDDALMLNVSGGGTDVRELNDNVREIREQGSTRVYADANGAKVVEYKNLKRTIR